MSEGEQPSSGSGGCQHDDAGALYQALVSLWIHQDQLLWSRLQTLLALNVVVLAAGYAARPPLLGAVVLFVGFLLNLLALGLVSKDKEDRNVNLEDVLDHLKKELHPLGAKVQMTAKKRWYASRAFVCTIVLLAIAEAAWGGFKLRGCDPFARERETEKIMVVGGDKDAHPVGVLIEQPAPPPATVPKAQP